jgi:predicted AAA+ superfamily ATPase
MLQRNITPNILAALSDTPVVLVHGARQTGKTTLVREIAKAEHPADYITFDDPAVRATAQTDPQGFVDSLDGPVVIDEVQRVPELALAIKASVDRNRKPGRFLLTGSANVLLVPRLSDSLAGRMEIQTLWPLSQGEIEGVRESFIDRLFAAKPLKHATFRKKGLPLVDRVVRGGFPELMQRHDEERWRTWFSSYLDTILQRDVRELANIEGLTALPNLLALLAARPGGLLNYADIARGVQMPQTTLKRYLALLQMTFLVQLLPPWFSNLGLRLVKSPKMYLCDTGLLVYLLKSDRARLAADPAAFGPVLENFIVAELRKDATWSRTHPHMFHYRTHTGAEVDVVLEGGGRIVGIEVKSSATITADDFKGLRHLAETTGDRFHRGVLLYGGTELLPFGPGMYAIPIPAVWQVADVRVG